MTKEEALERIYDLTEEKQMTLWSEFCRDKGYYEDEVFYNDDNFFDNEFDSKMSAARAVFYSTDYRFMDRFVMFNAYGNLKSSDSFKELAAIEDDDFVRYFCNEYGNEYGYPLEEEE